MIARTHPLRAEDEERDERHCRAHADQLYDHAERGERGKEDVLAPIAPFGTSLSFTCTKNAAETLRTHAFQLPKPTARVRSEGGGRTRCRRRRRA